jgi:hypothetical protein
MKRFFGAAVRTAAFLAAGVIVYSTASAQVVIDDFEMAQVITGSNATVVWAADGIIGHFRTGRVNQAVGPVEMSIDEGAAFFDVDKNGVGSVVLEWDGDNDSKTYSETGLDGVDLTVDAQGVAQLGIRFEVFAEASYHVQLVVNTDENYASSKTVSGNGSSVIMIPWLDFEAAGSSGGADFSNVGAITMTFLGSDDFAIGVVDTYPDDNVLPVELVSFDAVTSGSRVNLSWSVASESDNAGFYVEHRSEALSKDWEEIGYVASQGNTNNGASYLFATSFDLAGRHEFRLRQVDLDGTFSYSPVVEASVDVPGSFVLGQAYPNPFNPTTSFFLSLAARQNVEVAVFDLLGREVLTVHRGFLEGNRSHVFTVDGSSLTTGVYVVRAAGEIATSSMTVTLVK